MLLAGMGSPSLEIGLMMALLAPLLGLQPWPRTGSYGSESCAQSGASYIPCRTEYSPRS